MLLLLTDGKSQSNHNYLSNSATTLKNNYVNIISIGIGRDPKRSELELMASRPVQSHVFQVTDAYALSRIVSRVKTEACKRRVLFRFFLACMIKTLFYWLNLVTIYLA